MKLNMKPNGMVNTGVHSLTTLEKKLSILSGVCVKRLIIAKIRKLSNIDGECC